MQPGGGGGGGAYPAHPGAPFAPPSPPGGAYPAHPAAAAGGYAQPSGAWPPHASGAYAPAASGVYAPGSGVYAPGSGVYGPASGVYPQHPGLAGGGASTGPLHPASGPSGRSPAAGAAHADGASPQGTPFGRYVLTGELGRGGMGIVYRAWQPELKRYCAIKVLQGGDRERLVQEGQTVAKLGKHAHIVQVFDAGLVDGTAYIAMELVKGTPLDDVLKGSGPLDERRAVEIAYKVALALHHAHNHGLVHRDMKPANVILDEHGEPHVLDFGLAKDVAGGLGGGGEDRAVAGTPSYMPPEQMSLGRRGVDARSDVYALGATIFHLVAGQPPVEGTLEQIVYQLALSRAPSLRERAKASRDLDAVVAKAMEKRPDDRYASALEMASDLSRLIQGEPPHARRLGPVGRLARLAGRHPIAASVLVALVLGLSSASFYLRSRERELERLWRTLAGQVSGEVANETEALLAPLPPVVRELRELAALGQLPLADYDTLATQLGVRLRHRACDWLCYYVENGDFVGATRRRDKVVLSVYHFAKDRKGSDEVEYELLPDGSRQLIERVFSHYDTRTELGFQRGAVEPDLVWLEPYPWQDEAGDDAPWVWGITCAVRHPSRGELRGVFSIDVKLETLSALLARETRWPEARSYLLSAALQPVARSHPPADGDADPLLERAKAALEAQGAAAALEPGRPVVADFDLDGEPCSGVFEAFELQGWRWVVVVVAPVKALRGEVEAGSAWVRRIALAAVVALALGALAAIVVRRRQAAALARRVARA